MLNRNEFGSLILTSQENKLQGVRELTTFGS